MVCLFIAAKSIFTLINPEGAAALYELIITMTNVGMTLPYMFLIYAWYRYRNNPALGKDLIFFKSAGSVLLATIISLIPSPSATSLPWSPPLSPAISPPASGPSLAHCCSW